MNFTDDMNAHCSPRNAQLLGINDIDPIAFSDKYFNTKNLGNLSIDPNANVTGISPNNYLSEIAKPFAKQYFLRKLYEKGKALFPDFSLKHIYDGTIYMHDATKLQPYCFGVSATEIATLGRPYANLIAKPPQRLESFMGQLTEFIMDCSQEFAGAVAVTDLVPWMAWFVEKDTFKENPSDMFRYHGVGDQFLCINYTDKNIENIFQSFVHVLNNSFRVGGDSPFTNISVNSKAVYYDIFNHYVFPDGKTIDDLWETIKRIQKIIIDFMSKGRPDGLPYKFPILTANFKSDKQEMDSEWFKYLAEKNHKGFMNVNFAERFAMCCRLNLEFDFKQNSFGGGGVKVGSMRVTNLNLPRIAYKASAHYDRVGGDRQETLFKYLDDYITHAIEYLAAYSYIFDEMIEKGYLKFFKEPSQWFTKNMFFATVGFCGIWDAAEIMFPSLMEVNPELHPYPKQLFDRRVQFMEKVVKKLVDRTKIRSNGLKFNVEEVPSESAAGKMAKFNKDFGETKDYYSNQFVPLSAHISLPERIRVEAKLQSALTGGGMTFLNFDAEITPEQSYEIHKYMMEEGFTGQFCINYGYSHCENCSSTQSGDVPICIDCGGETEFYTRVVGYLAKMSDTASTKSLEVEERHNYKDGLEIAKEMLV